VDVFVSLIGIGILSAVFVAFVVALILAVAEKISRDSEKGFPYTRRRQK